MLSFAIINIYAIGQAYAGKEAQQMAKIAVVEDNDAMRAQLCGFIAQYAHCLLYTSPSPRD